MNKVSLLVATLLTANTALADSKALTLDVYNAGAGSFNVNATVVYGETEAIVVDSGFSKADALRIAAKVLDSGKELKTIFISQADPDYYFGVEVLHDLFPQANALTTPAVKQALEQKLQKKLSFWGPKLGANAPVKPATLTAYTQDSLSVDGHKIEIRGTKGILAHRPYLWIPDNKAIIGNIGVFGNIHLWMADTQTDQSINAWSAQLDEMQALKPEVVVPGHMKAGTKLNAETISYSQGYIKDFQAAKAASKNSTELIEKISAKYADPTSLALGIAAKVHMGEMKW
ncbi:MAG: glyoxylase-like metal-dependent hydrolase (beta-lactamase superfamily II) [Psychromonas sp.]|jgi:glyoxylase-like metal-dependent hydrolase (beta-lactamase superfamily II)|uniref:MBL fold metallo-hydrolase n=1 Tax=Psychromonas sp. TaxID=1884585 RepID=UPI0039E50A77